MGLGYVIAGTRLASGVGPGTGTCVVIDAWSGEVGESGRAVGEVVWDLETPCEQHASVGDAKLEDTSCLNVLLYFHPQS